MSLVHNTPLAWGCIVGVTVLGCLVGCSLKQEPMPRPSVPVAHEEAAPAPVPQAPAPQMQDAAPAGKPATTQIGTASWYGPGFHGRETASGETFNQHALTAAHRTLPLGTEAKVTNLATGQSVQVKINDRGPYVRGRHLDLSRAAATQIGLMMTGVAKVKIEATPPRQATPVRAAPWSGMPVTARQRSTVSRPRSVGEVLVRFTIYDPACHAVPPFGVAHAVPSS
jgi:rare lipoprotein A (peptidoglycan hydrolase)